MDRNDDKPEKPRKPKGAHQRSEPKAPPKVESQHRSTAKPRPKGPAPGQTATEPSGPGPITTPNLWGPDSALMKLPDVVERDLANEELRKSRWARLSHKKKIAVYIVSVIVVLVIFVALIVVFGGSPDIPSQ